MSVSWAKNTFLWPFVTVSEEEMKDIPHPTLELGIHVTERTSEMGCVLGGLIIAPIYRIMKIGKIDQVIIRQRAQHIGGAFALIGIAAGPLMTYYRLQSTNADEKAIYDRCYRLRHNKSQVLTDAVVTPLSIVGAVARGLHGFVLGTNVGLCGLATYVLATKYGLLEAEAPTTGDGTKMSTSKDEKPSGWTVAPWLKAVIPANEKDTTKRTTETCWCKKPNQRYNPNCKCTCHD